LRVDEALIGKHMYSIHLKPVHTCPAEDVSPDIHLPDGWKLSWHQLETLKALRDPNVDVVFNTAMTDMGCVNDWTGKELTWNLVSHVSIP
jgi:hypothetical protein